MLAPMSMIRVFTAAILRKARANVGTMGSTDHGFVPLDRC